MGNSTVGEDPATPVNIDELIDSRPIGRLQWRVVLLCFVLAMIDGYDAQSVAYVAPVLADQFSLSPEVLGQLLSAALIGLMVGALFGSPLADRFGRKPVAIGSVAVMGVFALLTAFANSTIELYLYRFVTGVGLGGVMPTINILTAEFAPARRRALLMTAMFVGLPIGIIVGGIAAALLINQLGWQSVFVVGGVLPLLLVPILVAGLPESPRFLALRPDRTRRLAAVLRRLAPEAAITEDHKFQTNSKPVGGGSIQSLFTHGRATTTLLLWALFFANLLVLNALIGWLPSLLEAAGFPLERAILATVLFSVGGVAGGLVLAVAVDRHGVSAAMGVCFLAATVAVGVLGQVTGALPVLLVVLFIAGATVMGSQFGLNAVAGSVYDTEARATGLGWALAVGRLGAIIGPILVGSAVGLNLPLSHLFLIGAIPMLLAAAIVASLDRTRSGNR